MLFIPHILKIALLLLVTILFVPSYDFTENSTKKAESISVNEETSNLNTKSINKVISDKNSIIVNNNINLHKQSSISNISKLSPQTTSSVSETQIPRQIEYNMPLPLFGLNENAPISPTFWESPSQGFYYVNENHPSSTDLNNPYGSINHPRRTIPGTESEPLPPGSVVQIEGKYTFAHSSPNDFHGKGTEEKPIFIRGSSFDNKAFFANTFDVVGSSYVIFENIELGDADGDLTGGIAGSFSVTDKNGKKYDSNNIVLRHSDAHGNLIGGGTSIGGYGNSIFTDIVFYKNKIHDNGNYQTNYDQDVHGTQIGDGSRNIWILESEYYKNSGDGIQINGKTADSIKNIYISKNISHHNKQVGFWTKKATNVNFVENISYGHKPSDSSSGQGMGFQYDPIDVSFIKNKIYDNLHGIVGDRDENSEFFKQNITLLENDVTIPYKAFKSE